MDMMRLVEYGASGRAVARWRETQGERLLPLQARAVTEYDLFRGGNLLVQAPTSSGKTFIGEMAAVDAAMGRGKAVYLVPLKALAEEKFTLFRERYGALGLRVIVSSRDHREHDEAFSKGGFDLAVAVYEKFAQLLTTRPERMNELGVVVADEMDLLADPDRGAEAEVLLTALVASGRRVIGLSASLGGADRAAEWLGARLLREERRPVELRYGVLHDGVYKYRTHNDRAEGEERLVETPGASTWEALTQNVRALAEAGESCLVFVKSKYEARRGAELLAGRVRLPAAPAAQEALSALESTRCRDLLRHTLNGGVAFHNTDLTPAERRVVEAAFRSGEARVLVSTGTLAAGMNLPAANVFLSADKWIYHPRFELPWRAPIEYGEYENMSGRAGRFGAGRAFGRSVLVASAPFDQESLWRCYVQAARPALEPPLAGAPLDDLSLRLVAARVCRSAAELEAFFGRTLAARVAWAEKRRPEELGFRVENAVRRCMEAGALRAAAGEGRAAADAAFSRETPLETTPFGRVTAARGISLATADALRRWVRLSGDRTWLDLDFLLAAGLTAEGRMLHVTLTAREYEHADYPGKIKCAAASQEMQADTPLNRLRSCRLTPFFDEVRAVKAALMLDEWLRETPLADIEEALETTAGQVLASAEQAAWLADAAAGLADALAAPQALVDRLDGLSARLARGVGDAALALARGVGAPLDRAALLALGAAGLTTPEAVQAVSDEALGRLLNPAQAAALRKWAGAPEAAAPEAVDGGPVLVVDDRRPGEIRIRGRVVPLQDKQYRLIRALAAAPGECVPYDRLYGEVWGDAVVEDNQMHFQKNMLLKRIAAAAGDWRGVIRTVPRRGFVLELPAEQVRCLLLDSVA